MSRSAGILSLARRHVANGERDCQRLMPIEKASIPERAERWQFSCAEPGLLVQLFGVAQPLAHHHWFSKTRLGTGRVHPWSFLESFSDTMSGAWNLKERRGQVVLKKCAPLLLHGDEGRGRKHSAFMVTSWFSLLGRGLRKNGKKKDQPKRKRKYTKF